MNAEYDMLDPVTLRVSYDMGREGDGGNDDWGAPRLSRIFNFEARQLITLYERGGRQDFQIPGEYSSRTGYTVGVTSSMQVQNFSELDDATEILRLHGKLTEMGGTPPAVDDLAATMDKKRPVLRPRRNG